MGNWMKVSFASYRQTPGRSRPGLFDPGSRVSKRSERSASLAVRDHDARVTTSYTCKKLILDYVLKM